VKITRSEEQGLRLAMGLARRGGTANLAELARDEGLSEALVAKILGKLRRGGVAVAFRGRNGRYELAAPADQIDTLQILQAFGTPLLRGCDERDASSAGTGCQHAGGCNLQTVWNHLESQVNRVLRDITLADLIRDEEQMGARMAGLWARSAGAEPEVLDPEAR
jgi:Rrf2 family protein